MLQKKTHIGQEKWGPLLDLPQHSGFLICLQRLSYLATIGHVPSLPSLHLVSSRWGFLGELTGEKNHLCIQTFPPVQG
jgi:hypothetical protein